MILVDETDDVWTRMKLVLIQIMRHPDCVYFIHPVDEILCDVPDYRKIVKQPMDLETICQRVASGWYTEPIEESEHKEEEEASDDAKRENEGEKMEIEETASQHSETKKEMNESNEPSEPIHNDSKKMEIEESSESSESSDNSDSFIESDETSGNSDYVDEPEPKKKPQRPPTGDGTSRGRGIYGVVEDLNLIYTNCRLYNGSDSSLYRYAIKMMDLTGTLLRDWILPLDPSIAELLPQRLTEKAESDDETPRKRHRKRASHRSILSKFPEVKTILATLATSSITSLPIQSQVTLLKALFTAVNQLGSVHEEREQREAVLANTKRELESISTQLVELEAVYARQELSNRKHFYDVVAKSSLTPSQKKQMRSYRYIPSETGKLAQERELAQFLAKKNASISDMRQRIVDCNKRIDEAQKRLWIVYSLGRDRHNREYIWLPGETPTRLWVLNHPQDSIGFLWNAEQLDELFRWLDNRGKNEQFLYSSLCRCKPQFQQAMQTSLQSVPQLFGDLTHVSSRKMREIDQNSVFLYADANSTELVQSHGECIGIRWVSFPGVWSVTADDHMISPMLRSILNSLFIPLFLRPDADHEAIAAFRRSLDASPLSLESYQSILLRLDELICSSVTRSYIQPDWIFTREFWKQQVQQAQTFASLHYLLGILKTLAVDFVVVDALTRTTTRERFLHALEKQVKVVPGFPTEGETVVYYKKGHRESILDFFRSNRFSGIFDNQEKEQDDDYLCKVQRIEYFEGAGNPFIRLTLKPISSTWLRILVQSYYNSLEKDHIEITIDSPEKDETLRDPFVVTWWLASNQSDFLIPVEKYLTSFSNNLRAKDRFRMWFQGVESTLSTQRRKRKDARAEGSFLYGEIVRIDPYEGGFFPWECVHVEWEGSGAEAGTERINPWECECDTRETREKREGAARSGGRSESHRLGEEELKTAKQRAAEVAATHTKREGEEFFQFLTKFWEQRGMEVQRPMLSYEELDLGLFWKLMQCYGGYEMAVNTKGCWADIHKLLPNFRAQNTSAPTSLHKIYLRYLWQLEKEQREEKGLPPIAEPRLPLPTTPGKSNGLKVKAEEKEEKKKMSSIDLALEEAGPGIQFIARVLKEQEKWKGVLQTKYKVMNASLAYEAGTIQTIQGEKRDQAYSAIVYGNGCMLRRQIEMITKFVSQLKSILNQYFCVV